MMSSGILRGMVDQGEAVPLVYSRDTQINTETPPNFQLLQAAAGGHTNELQLLIKQGEVDINIATIEVWPEIVVAQELHWQLKMITMIS